MGQREQEEEWKKGREIDALGRDTSCLTGLYFWKKSICFLW